MPCRHKILTVVRVLNTPILTVFEDGVPVDGADEKYSLEAFVDPDYFQVVCQQCGRTWKSSHKNIPKFVHRMVDAAKHWDLAGQTLHEAADAAEPVIVDYDDDDFV